MNATADAAAAAGDDDVSSAIEAISIRCPSDASLLSLPLSALCTETPS